MGSPRWISERYPVYVRVLLVVMLVVLPLLLHRGANEPFMIAKLTVVAVLGILSAGLWMCWSAVRRSWLPPIRIGYATLAFASAFVLATVMSQNRVLSLVGLYQRYGGLLSLAIYVLVMIVVLGVYWENPQHLRELAWAIAIGAFCLAVYMLLQSADLELARPGWIDPASGQPPEFPAGTMGNSNFAGAYLGISLPLLVYLAGTVSRRAPRAMVFTGIGLVSVALWFSQTRGGLLAAGAGLTTVAVSYPKHLSRRAKAMLASAFVAAALVAVMVVWHPGTQRPLGPLASVDVLRSSTLRYRAYDWSAAVRIFADHPIVGTGPETFHANHFRYRLPEEGAALGLTVDDKPHNVFLEYAAGTGVLGLGSYLALVGLTLWYGCRQARRQHGEMRLLTACFSGALAAYLTQAFFSIDVPPLAVLAWVVIGAVAALADPACVSRRGAPRTPPPASLRRWPIHVAIGAGVAVLLAVASRPLAADVAARRGRLAQAIDLHPYEATYRKKLGDVLQQQARTTPAPEGRLRLFRASEARYLEALRLDPGNLNHVIDLAGLNARWGQLNDPSRFADADRWWRRALSQDPNDAALRSLRQEELTARRQAATAQEAIARIQGSASAWVRVAHAYLAIGERRPAAAALERALAIEPANEEAAMLRSKSPP